MNVVIGITKSEREVIITTNKTMEELTQIINEAFDKGMLTLDGEKNERFIIPSKRIAYVNIIEQKTNRIGFAN